MLNWPTGPSEIYPGRRVQQTNQCNHESTVEFKHEHIIVNWNNRPQYMRFTPFYDEARKTGGI